MINDPPPDSAVTRLETEVRCLVCENLLREGDRYCSQCGAAKPVLKSVSEELKISDETEVKLFLEARTDVRSYATLLVQVLALLMTTLIIVMGWMAKDFASERYHQALYSVSPKLATNGPGAPVYGNDYKSYQRDLRTAALRFRGMMWSSPTTSLLLCGGVFFLDVFLGSFVVITYMIQRRRYGFHGDLTARGSPPEKPIIDPVLTNFSLTSLTILVAVFAIVLDGITLCQTAFAASLQGFWLAAGLWFSWAVVSLKLGVVGYMFWRYAEWEKREGWRSRWHPARALLQAIKEQISTHGGWASGYEEKFKSLTDICEMSDDDQRFRSRKRFRQELRAFALLVEEKGHMPLVGKNARELFVVTHTRKP